MVMIAVASQVEEAVRGDETDSSDRRLPCSSSTASTTPYFPLISLVELVESFFFFSFYSTVFDSNALMAHYNLFGESQNKLWIYDGMLRGESPSPGQQSSFYLFAAWCLDRHSFPT